MGCPVLTAFLQAGRGRTQPCSFPLSCEQSCPPPTARRAPAREGLGWEAGKRSRSAHLLLCVILSPRCLPEVGVFGGAVQDPGRPLHKVAGEIYFYFGIFRSDCECRRTLL